MNELFRPEAVNHVARRLEGEVMVASPVSLRVLTGLFAFIAVVVLIFVASASYPRKETVPGWIVPEGGLIRVQAREGGIVQDLPAREGALIDAGSPLATIRLSLDIRGGDEGHTLIRDLDLEAAASLAQLDADQAKLQVQRLGLLATRQQLQSGYWPAAKARVSAMEQRQTLSQREFDRGQQLLGQGYLSQSNLDSLQSNVLSASQDVSLARDSALSLSRQIDEVGNQLAALPTQQKSLAAQIALASATAAEKRVGAEAQTIYSATAPVMGRVVAVLVEVGRDPATRRHGRRVTAMGDTRSIVEIFVPARSAGFIKPGQEVRLMYDAYPHEKFGSARGVISSISRTALNPNEK